MRSPGAWVDRATRLYARLLAAYSPRFRRTYGGEMVDLFRARAARAADRRGLPGLAACLLAAIADLAWTARSDRADARTACLPRPKEDGMSLRLQHILRGAVRRLGRQPGFTATVVLTLSIGAAATIALFAVVDGAVLAPLPYANAGRLYSIVQQHPDFGSVPFPPPYLADFRERTRSFDRIAGFSPTWGHAMTGLGEPANVFCAYVSDGVMELVGAAPVEGRAFTDAELVTGGPRVAMVTRRFWDQRVGAGVPLDGQTFRLDGVAYSIVGILPSWVELPITGSVMNRSTNASDIWLPFGANQYATTRQVPVMNVVARARTEVEAEQIRADVESVGRSLKQDYSDTARWHAIQVLPLRDVVTRESRSTVLTLFGAASCLLLIACANVANLLIARASARSHELAIRASLGASRRQLVSELLAESFVLAAAGSGLGLIAAWWAIETIPALGLSGLPPTAEVSIDLRVAAFSAFLAAATTLAFGLAPAWLAAGGAPSARLRQHSRSVSGSGRLRHALVVGELAVSLSLLVGAGLFARSFWALTAVDPGFRVEGLVTVPVGMSGDRYGEPAARRAFIDDLLGRLESIPGVTAASAVNRMPLSGSNVLVGVEIEGLPQTAIEPVSMDRRVVTPGYFRTIGTPILEGRDFGPEDSADSQVRGAIVSDAVARRFWPAGQAVGRRLRLMLLSGPGPWLTVIGVAGGILHHGLDQPPGLEVYVPYAQANVQTMVAAVRSRQPATALVPAIKEHVWAIDRDMPVDAVAPVADSLDATVAEPRFRMIVLNSFAPLALLLAAVGIYGVIAYGVARARREIGIRIALGATSADVLRMVVGRGLRLAAWGALVGVGAAGVLTRTLGSLLYGVTPGDPLTFAAVTAVLVGVSALASYLAARRAARVDPVVALRIE